MPKVQCGLCFHHCTLEEGQTGLCRWLSSISPEIPLHLSRFFPPLQSQ